MNNREYQTVRNNIPLLSQHNDENKRKPKPISGLHSQFEQLKKKIKDVENKNQRIIQKIHNAFNFKKKGPYIEEPYDLQEDAQNIRQNQNQHSNYYDKISPINFINFKSNEDNFDNRSRRTVNENYRLNTYNHQTQSELQHYTNNQFRSSNQNNKSPLKVPRTHSPMGYAMTKDIIGKSPELKINHQISAKSGLKSQKSIKQYEQNLSSQLQGALEAERSRFNELLKQKKKKEEEINRLIQVDQKFRNFADTSKMIFESGLTNLMEAIIRNQMINIDKVVKKNELRMLNLSMMLREAHEDHRSCKIIKEHQRRRSTSKSARKVDRDGKTSRSQLSKSQVKISQESAKKTKQFQQIVGKYEQIIRGKSDQIQNIDRKLRSKQQQCAQLKSKMDNLIKKKKTQENESIVLNMSKSNLAQEQFKLKISEQELIISQERSKFKILLGKTEELQQSIQKKDALYLQLKQTNNTLQTKLSSLKNYEKHNEINQSVVEKIEKELQNKYKSISHLQQNISEMEKKLMQKDCQIYGIGNKLKKSQQMLQLKEKKIQELQKLLRTNEQVMQKSICMEGSMIFSQTNFKVDEMKRFLDQNQRLEEEVQNSKNQIYSLTKQKEFSEKKIIELQDKIEELKKKIQQIEENNNQKNDHNESDEEGEEEKKKLQEQIGEVSQKCDSLNKTIQMMRAQNLQMSSRVIKAESELEFTRESMKEKQNYLQKYRRENDELRNKIMNLQKIVSENEQQLQIQRKNNEQKIHELQKQWQEFQDNMKGDPQVQNERRSQISMVNYKSNYNHISTQNQYLTEKLKQAQSIIETQNIMEEKIISEYRLNVEKVKSEVKEKTLLIQKLTNQSQKNKKRIIQLEVRLKEREKNDNGDQNLLQRIDELENQLRQSKDINNKLTEMTNELFEQIKSKQYEKCDFIREIEVRNLRINQLEQLCDLQGGSRISSRQQFRQSMRSQIIMKESNLNMNEHSQSHIIPHEGTLQFQLSFDQSILENSHLNISELFRQMPYDKLKLKKREHKLFQKTSQYINSLKESLEEKCKKIRILQKKIQSLKSSQLVRKNYDLSGKDQSDDETGQGQFKDYESVQLHNRKGGEHRRFKMLENDTKLVVEENNMLRQQIQALEEEVQRAEEQQNSLVKIKDLYKDQIKKLIKKNDDQNKMYEEQLQKERARYEDSQSVHNFMALKQLFIKAGLIIGVNTEFKKREEKKKELEEYFKVIFNILKVDQQDKDQIIKNIRND